MARPLASLIFRDTISKALFNKFSPIVTKFRLNSSFEAVCLKEYGKPLVIDKFTRQPLNPGHVRVAVEYCSLNNNDVKYLEETYSDKTLPFIPGYELSGEVLEVGECCKDSNLTVGQRVVGIIKSGNGGIATEAVLRANSVWELHPKIPYRDAAAIVCGHSTAMLAFTQFSPLNEGDILLVIAGAGGYGLAAVDIAAGIFKSKVIAVVDTDGEGSLLRDRGAFAAFKNNLKRNYKEIMKASDNKGVHHIYDAVGGPILNTVIKCISNPTNGLVLGTYRLRKEHIATEEKKPEEVDSDSEKTAEKKDSDDEEKNEKVGEKIESKKGETKITPLSQEVRDRFKTVNIFNFREENEEEYYSLVSQVLQYYEEELVMPHISKTFEFREVNEAIDYIKGKVCTGKVLIKIKDD